MRRYIADCPRCGCDDPNKINFSQKHLKDKTDPEYGNKYTRVCRLICGECGFFIQNIDHDAWHNTDKVITKWNKLYHDLEEVRK
jgi:hypothetical protein